MIDHLKTGKNSGASMTSTVNQNNTLSKFEKLVYLRSLLKLPALTVIQSSALSKTNYETALDLIKIRLGKNILVLGIKLMLY